MKKRIIARKHHAPSVPRSEVKRESVNARKYLAWRLAMNSARNLAKQMVQFSTKKGISLDK